MSERCGGLGIMTCLCGGDFCICENYGEYDCEGCAACAPERFVCDDDDEFDPDADIISFGPGYMGDPSKWCYWSTEYPEEGSTGPFDSQGEAEAHAKANGAYDL